MSPIYNRPASGSLSSVLHGLPVPVTSSAPGSLKLFDKNARSMGEASASTPVQVYQSLLHPGTPGQPDYTMIQAVIRKGTGRRLLVGELLKQGTMLGLGNEKGIVVKQHANGDLVFYCLVLPLQERIGVSGSIARGHDAIRSFLKACYAGWHHIYHELFATATEFSTVAVCNTAIDELLRQIQAPLRFPA
ncbi:hypothetical protein [Taibaiella koreensis]|uniref:hypothetical protein n=1 Tax=Taibaiella koreensis TaxID=1268548 RepID=UPI0013C36EE5|nr:hypothetical protein [Taibaiella koreensis]